MTDPKDYIHSLKIFFKEHSTFEIRWKKSWHKDHISPGVYASELEEEYRPAEIRKLIDADLIEKTSYTQPWSGVRRSAYFFKREQLPQVTRHKRWLNGEGSSDSFLTWWAMIFLCVLLASLLIAYKRAWGLASTEEKRVITESFPRDSRFGYFQGPQSSVCMWIKTSDGQVALSCLRP